MQEGDFRKMFLQSRLAVTLAVLAIASGLLFVDGSDVKSNIASSLLGALMGYWFSIDGNEGQPKHIQINEGGGPNVQATDSAGERPANTNQGNSQ